MHSLSLIKALPLFACLTQYATVSAQHLDINIPQVDADVHEMLSQFQQYTTQINPHPVKQLLATIESGVADVVASTGACAYWMESIPHQGVAAFNSNSSYQVFRNVKSFGAVGDGVHDDTAAINAAISSGGRFGPAGHETSTNTPAVVYFPAGTYLISAPIVDYVFTQIIGNPNCMPVLKATPNFTGTGGSYGLIDGDVNNGIGATNIFYRQVRNLVFDMTAINGLTPATGIHWPTAQATSIQNCVFKMSSVKGTQHQGVFIESGSGGFVNDLTFLGGLYGLNVGNQQFTMRNLTFSGVVVAISQQWDWGWTYKGLNINNCTLAFNMSQGGAAAQTVAAVVIIDSVISNTPVGISTQYSSQSSPIASGSLVLENVQFQNVATAVQGPNGQTYLAGTTGSTTVNAYVQGNRYNPNGPSPHQGLISPPARPASLLSGSSYYQQSKPQYQAYPVSSFVSARSSGATGNGVTDDTANLQAAINQAASAGKILYVDAGTYKVTQTINVPAGARIVGESYSVIMSSGSFFNSISNPQPVVRIGQAGQSGRVEWSDMLVSTQGAQAGAILIEYNLAAPAGQPSGIWDVHTRIGGFDGSNLQVANCPVTNSTLATASNINTKCIAAFMSFHATTSAAGLYMENNWFWSADHDIDDPNNTQVTVYAGRGILIESANGPTWMYASAAEHHSQYQYQLYNTNNIFLGQIQTETPYYQPNPNATLPFPTNSVYHDPTFPTTPYTNAETPNAEAFGLIVSGSKGVFIYGAGHYSFFNNYNVTCSNQGNGETCQSRITYFENNSQVMLYDLHTVGTTNMISRAGYGDVASYSNNLAGFTDEIIIFRLNL